MDDARDGKVVLIAGTDEEAEIIREYMRDVDWVEVTAPEKQRAAA